MIIDEIKNIKSGRKELRQFGLTIGTALALLGGFFLLRGIGNYLFLFIASGLLLLLAFLAPLPLKPFQKIWMTFAILMGWVVSRIILIVLFYLILTPLGLTSRLFGHRFLDRKIEPDRPSYWNLRESKKFTPSDYEKQF